MVYNYLYYLPETETNVCYNSGAHVVRRNGSTWDRLAADYRRHGDLQQQRVAELERLQSSQMQLDRMRKDRDRHTYGSKKHSMEEHIHKVAELVCSRGRTTWAVLGYRQSSSIPRRTTYRVAICVDEEEPVVVWGTRSLEKS